MLLRDPFTKALHDARRSLAGWTVAIVAVGAMYASFWPTVQTPEMKEALAAYPEGLLEAFNYSDLTTAAGYLGSAVYGLLVPLLVAVFAIAAGARAVAGDEEAGTLDLVLAHPVGRVRLVLLRFAALAVGIVGVAVLLGVAMVALSGPAEFDGIGAGGFAAMTLHLVLFGLTFAALAFAVGGATGRRAAALGAGAGVAVLGYLANSVFPQAQGLTWTRELSPFHWYLGGSPLVDGVQPVGALLLAGATALLVAAGAAAFARRDVAV
ncbi:ABC-2 type transport system permease protein [Micromonospora citrea]|uniref:ABC-2 type transport system permease protein n=1 Tax=Micromonospora citrea TaxID=47855 RepID=A0A1C6VQ52_9ACTN|nr:ABC transporter permease subunit [Micromonospora citrea]SCL68451.1 ABC-2 type transport system permease protein [Micromonospora citrea]